MTPLQRIEELKRKAHSSDDIEILTELMILRARIEGEQVYLECLQDRLEWNRYPDSIQDQSIQAVGRKLSEAFKHTETRVYECAASADREICHRIATFEHLASGALLNLIPGGTYQMGGHVDRYERPIHKASIKPMLIGRTQVRQSVWDKIGGGDGRRWKGANLPIDTVSWDDAKAWLMKAGSGLRLPSEAEWEYACRAGSTTAFCFGKNVMPEQVNCDGSNPFGGAAKGLFRGETVEVGSLPYNAFGLHEVHGNLFEWCEDGWLEDYKTGPHSHLPRNTKSPSTRVCRGGCLSFSAISCRSANRSSAWPSLRYYSRSLRISRGLD